MAGKLTGKRVAIYARFSSDRQRDASIDDQVRRCREYVGREGGAVADALVFADYAVSGGSMVRSALEAMMAKVMAKPRGVDVIVTEDVSRITRDLADGAMLFKRLQFEGVALLGVADGIDTSSKHAKISYTIKNLMADSYLDDLRDKTLRGLEGRHLAGCSTGGLPYGYRSELITDTAGKEVGHRILIDEQTAVVVRRVFALYVDGRSIAQIVQTLIDEGLPSPRQGTKHRRKGWCYATVRVFLHNGKYTGVWRFKEREWVKAPGENRRQPRRRDEADVMVQERPELRIIDDSTWEGVQNRLSAVRATYTRNADGSLKGRARGHVGRGHYLFSGLLFCGGCGSPMTIASSKPRYRCPDSVRRHTCANTVTVLEEVARARLLETLRDRLLSPAGVAYARKRIAHKLAELGQLRSREINERRARLARTERRIQGLITFIADGDHSDSIRTALGDLEVQAKSERVAIDEILSEAAAPIRLPSPADVEQRAFDLNARLAGDPLAAREHLRRLFKNGRIILEPGPDRIYTARAAILPLVLLAPQNATAVRGTRPGTAEVITHGSGGAIHWVFTGLSVPTEVRLVL